MKYDPAFADRPATVFDAGDPSNPLGDEAAVAGTPALAAIEAGLGRHLRDTGYHAKHPLLYINDAGDPHVYVRFDVSDDGLGFLDTTYVYSPGVAQQLDEIFVAYGVSETSGVRGPLRPEAAVQGLPVHAHTTALITCGEEEYIQRDWDYQLAVDARPAKTEERRQAIEEAFARRQARLDAVTAPKFGRRKLFEDAAVLGTHFLSLPLNWDLDQKLTYKMWSNWRADPDPAEAARKCMDVWRAYVEPRLIHAGRGQWVGRHFDSWLSGAGRRQGGEGVLGDEWTFHDRLYWAMKAVCDTRHYWEDNRFSPQFGDCAATLLEEFEQPADSLSRLIDSFLTQNKDKLVIRRFRRASHLASQLRNHPQFLPITTRFERFKAISAFRHRILPTREWHTELGQYFPGARFTGEDLLRAGIRRHLNY